MKFVNKESDRKVREGVSGNHSWKTVKTGETIELPRKVGIAYGFTLVEEEESEEKMEEEKIVTEGKVSDKKVETKQFEKAKKKESLAESLRKIKGIGRKTVEDILNVYPSEEDLVSAISDNKELPFRDDVVNLLEKKYGSKK